MKRRCDCLAKWLIMLGFVDLWRPRVCRRPPSVLFRYVAKLTERDSTPPPPTPTVSKRMNTRDTQSNGHRWKNNLHRGGGNKTLGYYYKSQWQLKYIYISLYISTNPCLQYFRDCMILVISPGVTVPRNAAVTGSFNIRAPFTYIE